MYKPSHFQVNEAWIVFRASDAPVWTEEEGPCEVYVLMDAGSAFVFGQVLIPQGSAPDVEEIAEVLEYARSLKDQWAQRLIVTDTSAVGGAFVDEAKKNKLTIESIPLSEIKPIVGEFRRMFAATFLSQ